MKSILGNIENILQGILIILTIYHSIIFIITRDKSFGSYALYIFVVLYFLIPDVHNETSEYLAKTYKPILKDMIWLTQVFFVLSYALFTIYFLDLHQKNKRLKTVLKRFITWAFIISVPLYIIDYFFLDQKYFLQYNLYIFIPTGLIITTYSVKEVYKIKNVLSQFYLLGLLIPLVFSLTSLYYFLVPLPEFLASKGFDNSHFFMFGILFEVVLISVALGYKKLVYKEEREKIKEELIAKLKENQELKNELNKKLQLEVKQKTKEIIDITQQGEEYRLAEAENKLQTELNQLRLTSLVNQMNPHFIFNALNSIKLFIIENDAKNAVYYLNKFSKLIRKILSSSTQKETTLQDELETLELYVNIENIRFSNDINYSVSVDKSVNTSIIKVPSLILQPFIENAIWHGLSPKKGEKTIAINIHKTNDNFLQINIKDNGIGREEAEKNKAKRRIKRKSVGMSITKERLQNFVKNRSNTFSMNYNDVVINNVISGTLVKLKIPLL